MPSATDRNILMELFGNTRSDKKSNSTTEQNSASESASDKNAPRKVPKLTLLNTRKPKDMAPRRNDESDTIAVSHNSATLNDKGSGDESSGNSRLRGRKGKEPARVEPLQANNNATDEHEMVDIDDEEAIDEGIFDDEDDNDYSNEDLEDDVKSVISLSSTDEPEYKPDITNRPWRCTKWSTSMRKQWETMYTQVANTPIYGSWDITEDYQREKDEEMKRYLEDYPVKDWVIEKEQAEKACLDMAERSRWRALHIPIYQQEALRQYGQQHMQMPLQFDPRGYGPGPPMQPMAQYPPQYHPQQRPIAPGQYPIAPAYPRYTGDPTRGAQRIHKRESGPTKPKRTTAGIPALVPPYPLREKPGSKMFASSSKPRRKHAGAAVLPWNRPMDFEEAKANATWDDSKYDPEIMAAMAAVRAHNEPFIMSLDGEVTEKQRVSRNRKRTGMSSDPITEPSDGDSKSKPAKKGETGGDPYHSGNFCFATSADQKKALALKCKTPDEVLEQAQAGNIDWEDCKGIKICWNPGKKGMTEHLQQSIFRVYDTLITREQVERKPVFTKRAAECIVDFCPDILWREILLRLVSEAGYTNKDIRNRFCFNGCYCDKATVTKRIAAALGAKQTQSKTRGDPQANDEGGKTTKTQAERWGDAEARWFHSNWDDYRSYMDFFGAKIPSTGPRQPIVLNSSSFGKRNSEDGVDSGHDAGESKKRVSQTIEKNGDAETNSKKHTKQEDDDSDGVSAQDSDILDEMDED